MAPPLFASSVILPNVGIQGCGRTRPGLRTPGQIRDDAVAGLPAPPPYSGMPSTSQSWKSRTARRESAGRRQTNQ
jgi:hypothetical protein